MHRLWICSLVLVVAPHEDAAESKLSAEDILQKAIEVQKQHEDAGNEVKYDYDLVSVTEKLDKQGEVKKVEEHLYRSTTSTVSPTSASSRKTGVGSPTRRGRKNASARRSFARNSPKAKRSTTMRMTASPSTRSSCHATTSNASTYDHSADANVTFFGSSRNPASSRSRKPSTAPSTKPRATFGSTPRASRSYASSSSCGKKSGYGGG